MLIGYLPASSSGVDRASTRRMLVEARCNWVVEEQPKNSEDREKPELQWLLKRMCYGDTLIVPCVDSLGDSLAKIQETIELLTLTGIGLRSLDGAENRPPPPYKGDALSAWRLNQS